MPANWSRNDSLAVALHDDPDAKAWEHTETDAVVTRSATDDGRYVVHHYLRVNTYGDGRAMGTNRTVLFRDTVKRQADSRIVDHLRDAPDGLDTDAVRRAELSDPRSIHEWGDMLGAETHMTEKIGNRKRSSGSVALFAGSSRHGDGAYVAVASENGPRGRDFVSVGTEPEGFYRVKTSWDTSRRLGGGAYEVECPTITFDGKTITATAPNGRELTVEATGKTPSSS